MVYNQSIHCFVIEVGKRLPKETNPPFVLKSSISSPLSSGGGMGDQVQGGALAHSLELPTSISSCRKKNNIEENEERVLSF